MSTQIGRGRRWSGGRWLLAAVLLAVVAAGLAAAFVPELRQRVVAALGGQPSHDHDHGDGDEHGAEATGGDGHADEDKCPDACNDHDHAGHDHAGEEAGHAPSKSAGHRHDDAAAIPMSPQARGTIGLRLARVELRDFQRTISVPGIVVERPGWSLVEVTAPMTAVVTRIYPIQGEAVEPGQPLFDLRLTHEDLLEVQAGFLRSLEELDVIAREVARLEKITAEGVIAGKSLLERKYEQQKQEATLRAQRQALLLHGLSEEQVGKIAATRTLLQGVTIRAPGRPATAGTHPLQVQRLGVSEGKRVAAGDTLCTLADYAELYIEGRAFEGETAAINRAARGREHVSAAFGSKAAGDQDVVEGLHIFYLDDRIDTQSRLLRFYVELPNRLLREDKRGDGRRFVSWRFKPGQRMQIRIPVERWPRRIVLPVEAVALEGAESYVFEFNDDHFDRRTVHVEYRDQDWVVIADDGALTVGAMVAASAAHQVQAALKKKAGGEVDAHAGHNH